MVHANTHFYIYVVCVCIYICELHKNISIIYATLSQYTYNTYSCTYQFYIRSCFTYPISRTFSLSHSLTLALNYGDNSQ